MVRAAGMTGKESEWNVGERWEGGKNDANKSEGEFVVLSVEAICEAHSTN